MQSEASIDNYLLSFPNGSKSDEIDSARSGCAPQPNVARGNQESLASLALLCPASEGARYSPTQQQARAPLRSRSLCPRFKP